MTWTNFISSVFLGFVLSLLSLLGSLHLHLPHFDFDISGDHGHAPHTHGGHTDEASRINFGTVSAFLAWFGGTGYVLARFSSFWSLLALGLACASGLVGAAIVFFFLAKVLIRKDEELNPADYDMIGVLGTVTSNTRPSGTGEMRWSRRDSPCRSSAGETDSQSEGTEVVVTSTSMASRTSVLRKAANSTEESNKVKEG
jgi:membrane protein implicated in regulation of membrane protease activity